MARKSNFIGTTETGQLSAIGNSQQREFEFIRNLINDESILQYFAEPSLHENQEKIDWYSQADGKIKKFQDFDIGEIDDARSELNELMAKLQKAAQEAKTDIDRETILNLTVLPDLESIKKVGDQFVIINWAYKLRKRGEKSEKSANFAGFIDQKTTDHTHVIEPQKQREEFIKVTAAEQENDKAEGIEQSEEQIKEQIDDNGQNDGSIGINQTDEGNSISRNSLFNNPWVWMAVFLFLLILNILMLKDACGIKSIPFLNFC